MTLPNSQIPNSNDIEISNEKPEEIAINREIYSRSYYEFFKDFWPTIETALLEDSLHIKYLCDEVQKVIEWSTDFDNQPEDAYDLLINVAPGTSKSSIVSKLGAVWAWTKKSDLQIFTSSYSARAVKSFTRKFTKVLQDKERTNGGISFLQLYPHLELVEDNVETQTNKSGGMRIATSTGGAALSLHADFWIIDDHHKPPTIKRDSNGNPKLEMGATITEILSSIGWHDDVILSRKTHKQKTRTIYVQQRLHRGDLSGHIIKQAQQGAKNLKHINLPAQITKVHKPLAITYIDGEITKEEDLKYLYKDDLLSPKRLSRRELENTRKIGSYVYNSQYQQTPSQDRGGYIKTKNFIRVQQSKIPDNLVKFFYSDTSEGKSTSDNMATAAFSLWEGKVVIWEVGVWRLPFPEFIGYRDKNNKWIDKAYEKFVKKWGTNYQSMHFFEAKSSGTPYMQYINAYLPYMAVPDIPNGSKLDRVLATQGTIESGRVHLVEGDWIDNFFEECRNFTGQSGEQDDQVDVLTGLIRNTNFEAGTLEIIDKDKAEPVRVLPY